MVILKKTKSRLPEYHLNAKTPFSIKSVPKDSRIVALIITYNPDERLIMCVESLIKAVCNVLIIDNNSTNKIFLANLQPYFKLNYITIIELDVNRGIAGALNYGVDFIKNNFQADYVLTLDQDTILVKKSLIEVIKEVNERFNSVGIIALGTKKTEKPINYREIKYYITSGNLVNLDVFKTLRFREEFFIDQVDIDFDYEVIRSGYKIVIADGPFINHRLGTKVGILHYEPPIRLYYIIRNSTVLLTEKKLPFANYLYQLLFFSFSSLIHDNVIKNARVLIIGFIDGLNRNLGKGPEIL